MPSELSQVLERVNPPDGWYKNDTADAIELAASRLLAKGHTVAETSETLLLVIGAVQEEYGE